MITEDEKVFFLIDQINENELFDILEEYEGEEYPPIPKKSLENIKQNAYNKLGIKSVKEKTRWRLWGSLAASLVFILLLTASIGSDAVWAKLQKALQYIPGMNMVIEDKEKSVERYVLAEPVEKQIGGGTIKIEGVIVDKNNAIIDISAQNLPLYYYKEFFFKNAKGQRFNIDSCSIGGGTGQWRGEFVHSGYINDITGLQIVMSEKDNVFISLPLERARKFASYSEMGPTFTVRDISITAITAVENGKTRINLIYPPINGMRIEAFGTNLLSGQSEIILKDNEGKSYKASHDSSYMGTLSEFYFDTGKKKTKGMVLSVPHVSLCVDDQDSVRIRIPRKGAAIINNRVMLGGFPVVFEKIRRLEGNKIQVDVNLGYDQKAAEGIYDFRIDETSYAAQFDRKTGVLRTLEFEIFPDQFWIKLKLKDPLVYKKGPWEIKLDK